MPERVREHCHRRGPPTTRISKAEATFRLPADARLLSLAPHMHYRGKHYFYEAIYPDGKKETLLSVPRWDFNWQNVYRFQQPVKLPKGTKVHSVAHWDNSPNNLLNPAPDKTVGFGLQSWDEMMVGFVSYVWEHPDTPAEPSQESAQASRYHVRPSGRQRRRRDHAKRTAGANEDARPVGGY